MTTAAVGVRPAYSPRMWVYGAATIAAVAVIAEHLRSHFAPGSVGHHRMAGMPGMAGVPETHTAAMSLAWLWMWWVVMTAAMMLPLAAGEADRIAAASLWGRRHVAVIEHLACYLAVWSVFGLAAIWVVDVVWPSGVPAAAPVLALLSAAMWQVTGLRKRALRRCGRPTYINVRGWRADRDCVIAGVSYGRRCLITCAPVMAVMALAHSALLMVALAILLFTERAPGPNPARRAGRPLEAVLLVGMAVGLALWGVVGRGHLP